MTVTVNGESRDVADGVAVDSVVRGLDADRSGTAVAVNDEVVPRGSWASYVLHDGDRVEVLTAVQGG
jgi:sulfur carrier protein